MSRREFIAIFCSAVTWPPIALAQQSTNPVVGFISSASRPDEALVTAFVQGLNEMGYAESRNVTIEYRLSEGKYERLPAFAAEFANWPVAAMAVSGLPAALAAKAATSSIPIVFHIGADPVQLGLVASLNRPGGNVTGVYQFFGALGAKRLELAREIVPSATTVAVLVNPGNPNKAAHLGQVQSAARDTGLQLDVVEASNEPEIDSVFAAVSQRQRGVLLVADDPFFTARTEQLVKMAARYSVPAIFYARTIAEAGGLISYGPVQSETYRQFGIYTGRVLGGTRPADLPVVQPTKFELVINLKTAKALGLAIPASLLARADEVIE